MDLRGVILKIVLLYSKVKGGAVCPKHVESNGTSIGRGGAVAQYVEDSVLLCGGRDKLNRYL